MTLTWLGSNGLQSRWQGIGDPNDPTSDVKDMPTPRSGDLYLDIEAAELYTYDEAGVVGNKWFSLNG